MAHVSDLRLKRLIDHVQLTRCRARAIDRWEKTFPGVGTCKVSLQFSEVDVYGTSQFFVAHTEEGVKRLEEERKEPHVAFPNDQ